MQGPVGRGRRAPSSPGERGRKLPWAGSGRNSRTCLGDEKEEGNLILKGLTLFCSTPSNSIEPRGQRVFHAEWENGLMAQRDSQENLITHCPSVPQQVRQWSISIPFVAPLHRSCFMLFILRCSWFHFLCRMTPHLCSPLPIMKRQKRIGRKAS